LIVQVITTMKSKWTTTDSVPQVHKTVLESDPFTRGELSRNHGIPGKGGLDTLTNFPR